MAARMLMLPAVLLAAATGVAAAGSLRGSTAAGVVVEANESTLAENATNATGNFGDSEEPEVSLVSVAELGAELALLTSAARCPHSDKVNDPSQSCAAAVNRGCEGCYLYDSCGGRSACVVNGYLVVPGSPLRGMEDINGGNAGNWDYLWSVARGQCGGSGCVLITNPAHFRSQHQMHVHFRQYNGGGAALKARLEAALCDTSGWQSFSECGGAKARLYDSLPGVFSAVAGVYGGGSLANVGITVWSTTACGGGQKTMVLATVGCSIEHSISPR